MHIRSSYLFLLALGSLILWSESFPRHQLLSTRSLPMTSFRNVHFVTSSNKVGGKDSSPSKPSSISINPSSTSKSQGNINIPLLVKFMKQGLRRKFIQLLPPVSRVDFMAILKYAKKYSNSLSLPDLSNVIWTLGYIKRKEQSTEHLPQLISIFKNVVHRFNNTISTKITSAQGADATKLFIGLGKLGIKWSHISADSSLQADFLSVLYKSLHQDNAVSIANMFHSIGMMTVPFSTLPKDLQDVLTTQGITVLRKANTHMIGAIATSLFRMQMRWET
jgi:hypothetical protein